MTTKAKTKRVLLSGRQLAAKHGFKKVSKEQFNDSVAAYTGGPVIIEALGLAGRRGSKGGK
jgi:hypothetical protein